MGWYRKKLLNIIIEDDTDDNEYCVFSKAFVDGYKKGKELSAKEHKERKEKLLAKLNELSELKDLEIAHVEADEALVKYIDDKDIVEAFEKIEKWYS